MKRYFLFLMCACLGIAQPSGGEDAPIPPPASGAETPAPAPESDEPVMDIRTGDGRVFRNATVERVTPSGVDIGYLRQDGTYAMIGLPLSSLTPDLQKKFGYDPEKARQFEDQLKAANAMPLDQTAESEAERMARVTQEVKARLSGADIRIQPSDLRFAIYANRRPVVVVPVERVLSGTVVAIIEDNSGQPKLTPPLVLIDQLELAEGTGKWSGFLYPTGMHARYRDLDKIPVYADTLENAQVLLDRYLDIYSDFAAAQKANAAAGTQNQAPDQTAAGTQNQAPDQAQAAADNTSGTAGVDNKGGNVPNNGYYDNTGVYSYSNNYPYYIGGSYWPVVWWSSNCWNHNRPWPGPPRPYPPRPPRPPQPYPPHPQPYPPHPQPQPYPPRPQPYPPRPQPPRPQPQPGTSIPGFGYQTERNGGFRRVVPSPAPAMPTTWPGTPVPVNPPRMNPRPEGGGGGGGYHRR